MKTCFDAIEKLTVCEMPCTSLPSGMKSLDSLTSAHPAPSLLLLGAPTSSGSTSLAIQIATRTSIARDHSVLYITSQHSKEQLALRTLCAHARVNLHDLAGARVTARDWAALARSAGLLWKSDFSILDQPVILGKDIERVVRDPRFSCRRARRELGLIILDSFTDLQAPSAEHGLDLYRAARSLGCSILVVCQVEHRQRTETYRRGRCTDMPAFLGMDRFADLVLTMECLERNDYCDIEVVQIDLARSRIGPTGTARVHFHRGAGYFEDPIRQSSQ